MISGLIGFSARANPGFATVADDLRARVIALGRAHDFVRPHSAQSRPVADQTSLQGLLAELFEPYQSRTASRITISGDDVAIDDRSATPIALLFHELATNATKYGALYNDDGAILVHSRRVGDRIVIEWRERGGPMVQAPAKTGFGSQLIELSAVRQLAGTVAQRWERSGLEVEITLPESSLSRN